ncbi:uncharacterized protein [Miscanthus floridulus]|uniref:uncharacterized protein isoform X5 n=1 Tax=Miscanthus floridulus TaxID=154761 RepID=UPI0034598BA0
MVIKQLFLWKKMSREHLRLVPVVEDESNNPTLPDKDDSSDNVVEDDDHISKFEKEVEETFQRALGGGVNRDNLILEINGLRCKIVPLLSEHQSYRPYNRQREVLERDPSPLSFGGNLLCHESFVILFCWSSTNGSD